MALPRKKEEERVEREGDVDKKSGNLFDILLC